MKRSSHLKLTLMAIGLPAALAGCDAGPPTGAVLASVEDCRNTDGISLDECRTAYQTAAKEHERVAPRFSDARECNEQFGNCEERHDGDRSYFMPPMTGFLIGYAMGGGFNRNREGSYGPRTIAGASPLYRDYHSGDYLKPNGDLAGRQPGNVRGARGNAATPTRAITVARSGFGSRSGARGSFGG